MVDKPTVAASIVSSSEASFRRVYLTTDRYQSALAPPAVVATCPRELRFDLSTAGYEERSGFGLSEWTLSVSSRLRQSTMLPSTQIP